MPLSVNKDNENEKGNKEKGKQKHKVIKVLGKGKKEEPQTETKQIPLQDGQITTAKFIDTDRINPDYVNELEDNMNKSRIQIFIMMNKFAEIVQWHGGITKWLMDAGFDLQTKSKENPSLLNIVDRDFDMNWVQQQAQIGMIEQKKQKAGSRAK